VFDCNPHPNHLEWPHGRDYHLGRFYPPSDAFAFWKAVGLSVDPHRVEVINVDGGPGAPGDLSGSFETTLDVEQSGGIAAGARVIVYQAPNSGQGFVDAFAFAVDSNSPDSLSTSWGIWE
jgi:kumamolisin